MPTVTLTSKEHQIQVGRPFEIELTVRHPEQMVVIFPDTAKDFKPYEVHSGQPVPTHTDEGNSEDVKIYKLYSWEIDSVQHVQLPVRFLNEKGDTSVILSNPVDLEFLPMIQVYSDTLKLKSVETLATIQEPINWIAIGIVFTASALVIMVVAMLTWKPIRKWWRRRMIEREWRKHHNALQALKSKHQDQPSYFSELNQVWRGYLDRRRDKALSSMTTTELRQTLPQLTQLSSDDQDLLLQLSHSTDKVLYAGLPETESLAQNLYMGVEGIMQREYRRRKEAIEL